MGLIRTIININYFKQHDSIVPLIFDGWDPVLGYLAMLGNVKKQMKEETEKCNAGGASRSGSGTPRNFGGGGFYAGGARVPYTAGRRSPGGLVPFFLPVALLGFFPGLWLFGAYAYSMNHGYSYRNRTTNRNESIPIVCLCQEHSVCGCDDNNNSTYIDSILSDKDENGLPRNSSVVKTVDVNGTTKIYINGTLPNGTTAPDPSIAEGMASGIMPPILKLSGYWPTIAIVLATVALL
ncbi:hypothetical protein LOZ40_003261 [Ophidiomyces ophidiicola]|nr:hypothetical protein LOZ40_003261 [Ophidiomyces ophidiicola]